MPESDLPLKLGIQAPTEAELRSAFSNIEKQISSIFGSMNVFGGISDSARKNKSKIIAGVEDVNRAIEKATKSSNDRITSLEEKKTKQLIKEYADLQKQKKSINTAIENEEDQSIKRGLQKRRTAIAQEIRDYDTVARKRNEVLNKGAGAQVGLLGTGRSLFGGTGALVNTAAVTYLAKQAWGFLDGIYERAKKVDDVMDAQSIAMRKAGISISEVSGYLNTTGKDARVLADDFAIPLRRIQELQTITIAYGGVVGKQNKQIVELALANEQVLKTPAEELVKVFSKATDPNNIRALKGYGLVIKEGASQTEVWAAIMKKFGGSVQEAKDTSKDAFGDIQRAANKLDESLDDAATKIVKDLAPALKTLLPIFATIVGYAAKALEGIELLFMSDKDKHSKAIVNVYQYVKEMDDTFDMKLAEAEIQFRDQFKREHNLTTAAFTYLWNNSKKVRDEIGEKVKTVEKLLKKSEESLNIPPPKTTELSDKGKQAAYEVQKARIEANKDADIKILEMNVKDEILLQRFRLQIEKNSLDQELQLAIANSDKKTQVEINAKLKSVNEQIKLENLLHPTTPHAPARLTHGQIEELDTPLTPDTYKRKGTQEVGIANAAIKGRDYYFQAKVEKEALQQQSEAESEFMQASLDKWTKYTDILQNAFSNLFSNINNKFLEPFKQSLANGAGFFGSFVGDIVGGLVELGEKLVQNLIMEAVQSAITTSTAIASLAAIQAAAAPAALLSSIASFGGAAVAGTAGVLGAMTLVPLLSSIKGLASGGTMEEGGAYMVGEGASGTARDRELVMYPKGGKPTVIPLSRGGQYPLAYRFGHVGGGQRKQGGSITMISPPGSIGSRGGTGFAFANSFGHVGGGQDKQGGSLTLITPPHGRNTLPGSLHIGGFINTRDEGGSYVNTSMLNELRALRSAVSVRQVVVLDTYRTQLSEASAYKTMILRTLDS